MGVGEEVLEAGGRQVLLDARPPVGARPVGAFRQPAARRRAAEQPPVLVPAHGQLQADALVASQQGEIAVRGRRADDLQVPAVLEPAERGHDVAVDRLKQVPQPAEVRLPELHERREP